MSLSPNSYYVKAGIWGAKDTDSYDLVHKSENQFKIYSTDQYQGLIQLACEWN